jgi:hypothetical protein
VKKGERRSGPGSVLLWCKVVLSQGIGELGLCRVGQLKCGSREQFGNLSLISRVSEHIHWCPILEQ